MIRSFSFLLLCVSTLFFSQVNRFYYELTYKPNSKSTDKETILTILDTDKDKSLYLNQDLARYDSIIIASQEHSDQFANFDWVQFNKNLPKNSVKIIKEKGRITQKEYIGEMNNYNYTEKINLNWKLDKETATVQKYNSQKATTDFGGRKWTAWFTSEIPINEGPYKFFGLPGLIVKIEDSEHEYSWELKGNILCKTNCNIQFDSLNERQIGSINISKEKIKQLRRNYAKDPLQGADVVNPNIDPNLLREYKNMLIKKINYYDNPIERN